MATNEDLSRTYDDVMKAFENAVIIVLNRRQELPRTNLSVASLQWQVQCKILAGIYVELVEARHERRSEAAGK